VLTSQKNTNKKRRVLTNRKFNHSPLNHDYRNSQEGTCSQCSNLMQVCAAFGVYWVICSLQDSSSFKTHRLRWRRALQTVVGQYIITPIVLDFIPVKSYWHIGIKYCRHSSHRSG